MVLLPYRFTLFSNGSGKNGRRYKFYYLIDLHYSQTRLAHAVHMTWFYYLIDLHYSQTTQQAVLTMTQFYYLIDLHYSQTRYGLSIQQIRFYYLIDLHYSQTHQQNRCTKVKVLLPYRFTLFSNSNWE